MTPYYQDLLVTIYHGDCREVREWLDADLLVTDPPYGIAWSKGLNKAAGSRAHVGIQNDHDTSVRDDVLALWGDRPAVVFGSFYAPQPPCKHVLVWEKPRDAGVVGSTTGYRRDVEAVYLIGKWPQRPAKWGSVIRSRTPMVGGPNSNAGRTGHPHAKPVDLISQLIERAPVGSVCDPFMGSGTTIVAARALGRSAIGIEIEERYCEAAAERCRQGVLDFGGAA